MKKGDDNEDEKESDNVEKAFIEIFNLIKHLFITFALIAFLPKRFFIFFREKDKRLTGPYTFLAVSGFFVIKLLRISIVSVLLLFALLGRGCTSETLQTPPEITIQDIFSIPTLEDLLFIGAPIALVASIYIAVLDYFFKRNPQTKGLNIGSLIPYTLGFQFILLYPTAILFFLIFNPNFGWNKYIPSSWDLQGQGVPTPFIVTLIVAIVWPALFFYLSLNQANNSFIFDKKIHKIRRVWLFMIAFLLSLSMIATSLLVAYPLARLDYLSKYVTKPILSLAMLGHESDIKKDAVITIVVTNLSSFTEPLGLKGVTVVNSDAEVYEGEIIRSSGDATHAIILSANSTIWMDIKIFKQVQNNPTYGSNYKANYPEIRFSNPNHHFALSSLEVTGKLEFWDNDDF